MNIEQKVLYGVATTEELEGLGEANVWEIKRNPSTPHRMVTITRAADAQDVILTEESPDRVGDIVLAKGIDTTNFDLNPVMLWGHDIDMPNSLLGVWETPLRRVGKQTRAKPVFMDPGINPVADMAREMFDGRWVRGASIGFLPKKTARIDDEAARAEMGLGRWGVVYEEIELLEASLTPLPMHPHALRRSLETTLDADEYTRALYARLIEELVPLDPISKTLGEILGLLGELRAALKTAEPNGTPDERERRGTTRSEDPAAFMRQVLDSALGAVRNTPKT